MKRYDVYYTYKVAGVVEVEANSKAEARAKFSGEDMDCEQIITPFKVTKIKAL